MNLSFYQLLDSRLVLSAALNGSNSIDRSSVGLKTPWSGVIEQLLKVERATVSEPNSKQSLQKMETENIGSLLELQSQLYTQAIRVELISKVAESASSTLKRLSQNAG